MGADLRKRGDNIGVANGADRLCNIIPVAIAGLDIPILFNQVGLDSFKDRLDLRCLIA